MSYVNQSTDITFHTNAMIGSGQWTVMHKSSTLLWLTKTKSPCHILYKQSWITMRWSIRADSTSKSLQKHEEDQLHGKCVAEGVPLLKNWDRPPLPCLWLASGRNEAACPNRRGVRAVIHLCPLNLLTQNLLWTWLMNGLSGAGEISQCWPTSS